ncbi:unnamed protein product, partial [Tetraodon nigroviridis]
DTPQSDRRLCHCSLLGEHRPGQTVVRRIKGRIHRSKSLDSIDLMDSNVSPPTPAAAAAAAACPVQKTF